MKEKNREKGIHKVRRRDEDGCWEREEEGE